MKAALQDPSAVESALFQRLLETLTSSSKPIPEYPGVLQPQEAADDLVLENHPTALRQAAVRELRWNRAGPAGAQWMIYDPDQLFRKQKLT